MLESAINKLSEKNQIIIRQRFFEDMKLDDIAKIYGVKKAAISRREKRALDEMRKILTYEAKQWI